MLEGHHVAAVGDHDVVRTGDELNNRVALLLRRQAIGLAHEDEHLDGLEHPTRVALVMLLQRGEELGDDIDRGGRDHARHETAGLVRGGGAEGVQPSQQEAEVAVVPVRPFDQVLALHQGSGNRRGQSMEDATHSDRESERAFRKASGRRGDEGDPVDALAE